MLQSLLVIARGYASKHWPQTTGTIIESRVEEHGNADGQLLFFPHVRYRYRVGEKEYESTNIRFPTRSSASRRWAQAIVAKYPVSAAVSVSYFSQKPSISVLEAGLTGNALVGVTIGLGFLLSTVVGWYYVLLTRKPY
jgi:hypothetical protein